MSGNPSEHRKSYQLDRGWWSHTEGVAPSQLFSCEQSWQQALRLHSVSRELIQESGRLLEETRKSRSQTAQMRLVSREVLARFWVARGRDP